MTFEEYERLVEQASLIPGLDLPLEEEIVRADVNWLIQQLYKPAESGKVLDEERARSFGVDPNEAINWGNLACREMEFRTDENTGKRRVYIVVEEAKDAKTLEAYIERWLNIWGWNAVVRTEW